jgi:glycosyltransferase involved in cell wall biosynthesis
MTLKVALVHDWLNQMGGAEDVLEKLAFMYPDAPVYTSMYWPTGVSAAYGEWDIRTTWLDKVPGIKRHHQLFLPLYPLAFESLDLSGYDVVLTNKSGFCHGVITPPETLHICYCLTPTRYVWRYHDYARQEAIGSLSRAFLQPLLCRLRMWDRLAADRVDRFVAISTEVQRRIEKYYRRDSVVVYPPVDTHRFTPAPTHDDYFLIVGRLVPYKRVDLAVEACARLGLPLKVGGVGRDLDRLKAMAGPTIEFLGYVPEDELGDLLAHCKAFLFPGAEDFGIAPIQAMAAGRPAIAYAYGGALDTVIEGVSGMLFQEQTVESLSGALESFQADCYDPHTIRRHAEQFDTAVFAAQMGEVVARAYEEHKRWS